MGSSSSSATDSNDYCSQIDFSGEENSKVRDVIEIDDSSSESDGLDKFDSNSNGESMVDSLAARSNEGCDSNVEERSSVGEKEESDPDDEPSKPAEVVSLDSFRK